MDKKIEEKIEDFNKKLRTNSGNITSEDPLVCFLYLLMRDHLSVGTVTTIINQSHDENDKENPKFIFTNGHLANYAKFLVEELNE